MYDPDDSTLRESIPGRGYEPGVELILSKLFRLRPAGVFVDVGSLYGYYALAVASGFDEYQVHAVEPNAAFADVLEANTRLNGLPIKVHRVAFSEQAGYAAMRGKLVSAEADGIESPNAALRGDRVAAVVHELEHSYSDSSRLHERDSAFWWAVANLRHALVNRSSASAQPADACVAEAIPFDDWAAAHKITPSIVKIDVHGYEGHVLGGMTKSLGAASTECVILELHDEATLQHYDAGHILSMLSDSGMKLYEVVGFRGRRPRVALVDSARRAALANQKSWTRYERLMMRLVIGARGECSDVVMALSGASHE